MWGGEKGYTRTLSGKTGLQISLHLGTTAKGRLGHSVSGIEANGDARPDLLAGEPGPGSAWLFDAPLKTKPPELEIYGAACAGSNGKLPHLEFGGRASIGLKFSPAVYAGAANITTWLMVDVVRSQLSLTPMGAPGCTGYALPTLFVATTTDAAGRAGLNLTVPSQTSLIGAQVHTQWVLFDKAANVVGFVTSNAARIRIGNQ